MPLGTPADTATTVEIPAEIKVLQFLGPLARRAFPSMGRSRTDETARTFTVEGVPAERLTAWLQKLAQRNDA